MNITAELVKELRDKTGVGMMDCKKALMEAEGDVELATEILRKKGIAVAAKRAGLEANFGVIQSYLNKTATGMTGALVKVTCETDFSANTDDMRNFSSNVAHALATADKFFDAKEVMQHLNSPAGTPLQKDLDVMISRIAENIQVKDVARFEVGHTGVVNTYIHPGSAVGTMVELSCEKALDKAGADALLVLAKDICMHAAVMNPVSIDSSSIDPVIAAKEKDVYMEQLRTTGKPEAMLEKIVEGKMRKFYEDVCLMNQKFIKDDKKTVEQYMEEVAKSVGCGTIKVAKMSRFSVGR